MFFAEEGRYLNANLIPGMEGTILKALDIKVEKAGADCVELSMPVGPNTRQPFGLLHGGASVVLAESAASIGAHLSLGSTDKTAVGLEINANHLRAKRNGTVKARAVPVHKGNTTMVWEIKITDEEDKLVCISRCTLAVVNLGPGT